MAQITCPNCGKAISDTSKTCPHCGFTPSRRRKLFPSFAGGTPARRRTLIDNPVLLVCAVLIIALAGIIFTAPKQVHPFDGLSCGQSRESVHDEIGGPNYTSADDQEVQLDLYTSSAFLGKNGYLQIEYDENGLLRYAFWYYSYSAKSGSKAFDRERKEIETYSLSVEEFFTEELGEPETGDGSRVWHLADGSPITLTVDLEAEQPILLQLGE